MTTESCQLTRRGALKSGGALVISVIAPACVRPDAQGADAFNSDGQIGAWLRIESDEKVTVFTGKAELGQGIRAALAQIAAEELDVPYDAVAILTADTQKTPDEGYTFGSLSIQQSGDAIRRAAAEARLALRELAAQRWKLPLESVVAADGQLSASGKRVSYGRMISERFYERVVHAETPIKDPNAYRIVGKSMPRPDIPSKVFGGESFIQDLRLPGMVFGRIVRPPAYGARLSSLDASALDKTPGVIKVLRDGDFLGVVAEREEIAARAAELLRKNALWNNHDAVSLSRDIGALVETFPHELSTLKQTAAAPDTNAVATRSARYERPFQGHASMSPSAAVALWNDGQLRVWTHSQGVYPLRGALAAVLSMPEEDIHISHKDGAGCYGHNGADDAAMDAAMLARAAPGRPVKLQWSREDEFQWEPYGPAMRMDVSAKLDETRRVISWDYDVWGFAHSNRPGGAPGNLIAAQHRKDAMPAPPARNIPQPTGGLDRNAIPLYDIPGQSVRERFIHARPVRTSSLRGLGAYGNVFAIESFMDELADAAGADPIDFRLAHLSDPRARDVLLKAAQASDWNARPRPTRTGAGRGVAFAQYKNLGAYYAAVVELSADSSTGEIKLLRITGSVDCGLVVNPDGVRNQIVGGAIQSASWTLLEAAHFKKGRSSASDWLTYPIFTFNDIPEIETVLIDRKNEPPLGVGEASQGPIAAAVANAVFDATGARLRTIPFTPDRLLEAAQKQSPTEETAL